ncbi:hypothetical protein SADUNF_Sadunf06G0025200 [Salix dunnii]|uniref:Uncharacterized protein n=1 Tax=Salix dunnii TaxID=1413687 RepID=A0A835MUN1_9ROSI|nr:hypothetical protein SADUNF_Sadunf06G0025200 [Salix dunnii]
MGQSLKKLAPGLLSNPSYFKARALNIEVVDELLGELSILSKETGAKERSEENKEREIRDIIKGSYEKYFGEEAIKKLQSDTQSVMIPDPYFFRAVCEIVEKINTSLNSTQLRLPEAEKLKEIYTKHTPDKGQQLKKEDFQKILQEVIIHSGFTGFGSQDTILFIFGIPLVTYFIKQRVAPKSIPNEVFIPGVTSASVYLLAKLNKT